MLKAAPPFSVAGEQLSLAPAALLAGSKRWEEDHAFEARLRRGFPVAATGLALPALAQKQGGTLRIYHRDNLPSASIHEEATISTVQPFMGIFNNLVLFDQQKPLNTTDTIVPDLAESWAWDDSKTKLTFKLRQGVKWHDGKPFTAKDVQCTWNKLTGKDTDDFRKNPRAIWWQNLKEVTVNGDHEATFVLNRPQPSFLALFASGYTPVYPCHVSTKDMRTNPIGTGPFKFVEFKRGESMKFVRNPDYWKKGKPYLDGIEWKVIENRSTRILAFVAGEFDMTFTHRRDDPAAEGRDIAGAQGHLRAGADLRLHQPDHQSRRRALQRSEDPQGHGADARPQGLHRHPERRQGRHQRRHAAAARRAYGACRPRCCRRCPAMPPTSRRAGPRRARSWRGSATARPSRSR